MRALRNRLKTAGEPDPAATPTAPADEKPRPDADDTPPEPATDAPAEPAQTDVSLDVLAGRLLSLDVADADALGEIAEVLGSSAFRRRFDEAVVTLLDATAAEVAAVASGDADGAVERLASAGQALGQACELHETLAGAPQTDAEPAETPEPATPPAAESPTAPGSETRATESPEPATLPEDADGDLLKEFVVECTDHLTAAEAALLELESAPENAEEINRVFRAFHTIKGTSGFLGLERIQKLAHLAENMLDRGRDGEIRIVGGYADLALQSCDALRAMIEPLVELRAGEAIPEPANTAELLETLRDPEAAGVSDEQDAAPMRVGDILVGQGKASREQIEQAAETQDPDERLGESLVRTKAAKASDVAGALRTQKSQGASISEGSIRVGTNRLDNLINMVGELVIAQSMVSQDPAVQQAAHTRLARSVSHAGKIVRELQDLTMSLRMVPLKGLFQKMARLVRDLARKSGKKVRLTCEGEETEIDRNMVEVLKDPLVHMIRNACDHGVEAPDARAEVGKDPTGTVSLRAYHSAGSVVIEVTDDGKGLDREKILAKATDRGLIEGGRDLSDSEVYKLIWEPGFSTAEQVTNVSGRGVGMDVVKRNIEKLRGRIDVAAELGAGSTFTMRLPLTMAITDAMLLRVGQERYLLPTVSIEQSFRPEPGAITTVTGRGEIVTLRGDLLPVFRLHELFGIDDACHEAADALLIVLEGEGRRCALMVDELLGQQQVVIKSLGESLGQVPGVAGGAILGDGQVGLILDATGLLKLARRDSAAPAAA